MNRYKRNGNGKNKDGYTGDALMQCYGPDLPYPWPHDLSLTTPSVNIIEESDSHILELAVPGLKKNELEITLEGKVLTIAHGKGAGGGKQELAGDGGRYEGSSRARNSMNQYSRREYDFPAFSRSFILPQNSDIENISADYKHGILRVKIPRQHNDNEHQKIPVR